MYLYIYILFIEANLETKLPTIWTDEKQRWEESEKRREEERERVRRKKIQAGEKVGKSRNTMFFQWFEAPEGRKGAKAAGAEPAGQMRDEKLHAVVARSTFPSQNVQNTPASEHFWKLRCRKSARRCGAKLMSKSKCTEHTRFGPLLEVAMSTKCTPLWREAHLQVKKLKALHVRNTFGSWDVEKVHAVVARSTFRSQNVQNTPGSEHFWKLRCRKSARRCGAKHVSKSKVQKPEGSEHFLTFRCRFAWQAQWIVKSEQKKKDGFCNISKNNGRRGTFEEDLLRCIFRGRRSTRDMFIRAVRRSGGWFPERGCRGCNLEPQIFRFAEMILRDRCSTSYDLTSVASAAV